jgi:Temperature dependent protein affecting M2 dsRNA replication
MDKRTQCDGIMGSFEMLLYNIDYGLITKLDFQNKHFYGLNKKDMLARLNVNEDTFVDSMLMTGTSFLPTFPVLKDSTIVPQQPYTVKDAINIYRTAGKSMIALCQQWSEVIQKQEPNWEDKYRKARMAIKHCLTVTQLPNSEIASGQNSHERYGVVVSRADQLTGDHHEYIGLQLPEELYHYLIHGGIGPRIMNWLAYLEMLVLPPLDGGDSDEYRRLITQQLVPIQAQSISLYTSRMHRAFQHKNFTMRFWFDKNKTVVMNHQSIDPAPDRLTATWRVNENFFAPREKIVHAIPGSLLFAIISLEDDDFAAATISKTPDVQNIKSRSEVLSNTMWRFLHLRGYINDNHKLTIWGKALAATFKSLDRTYISTHNLEESAFLAFELLKYDQLNTHNRHEEWIGAPQRGSDSDKTHCLLIARCACFLKVHHRSIGYTGPLSKNLLAYNSIISAVRESDRDLIEAVLASMFLWASADRRMARDENATLTRKRTKQDWKDLGFRYMLSLCLFRR